MTGTLVGRRRALAGPLAVLGGLGAGVLLVAVVDPHEPGHYPTCPSLALTGLYCPGCGGLRMVNSLAHGDVGAAFGHNQLAFLMLGVGAYVLGRWTYSAAVGRPMRTVLSRPAVLVSMLAVAVVFAVVRNLPFAAVLAP
ncbi:DUF2752 domain-containing protein [Spirillospora sp. CA-294931]|uniref:DUF2752 domain-containing protein n=1 Tax=Spirillospora sp. CA-294931 TaxID=3240042 RepID=UPI003D8AF22C